MLSPLPSRNFLDILAYLVHVLVFTYLQTEQTGNKLNFGSLT